MTNYFTQGTRVTGSQYPRISFNPQNIVNSEYPDSLSISLANAFISPPTQPSDSLQRLSHNRADSQLLFSQQQVSQTSSIMHRSRWADQHSVAEQLYETDTSMHKTSPDNGSFGMSHEELIKAAFLSNRFSNRAYANGNETEHKQPHNGLFSTASQNLSGSGFAPLQSTSAVRNSRFSFPYSQPNPGGDEENQLNFVTRSSGVSSGVLNSNLLYSSVSDEGYCKRKVTGNHRLDTWLLYPPAPSGAGDHLRTGRVHEMKTKIFPDRTVTTSYIQQAFRQALRQKLNACLLTPCEISKFPSTLGSFTLVSPIDASTNPRLSEVLGYPTQCFKAWSPRLTATVLLRRVVLPKNTDTLPQEAYYLAKQICDLDHPSFVRLRDVFPTDLFSDNSIIFAYDYHPCSSTLHQIHLTDSSKNLSKFDSSKFDLLPEKTVWNYLVQLTQALRIAHQTANRAIGVLHPKKVIVIDRSRLLVNCFGLRDILNYNRTADKINEDKLADFVDLGKLLISVIFGTSAALQRSNLINLISQMYKSELSSLINDLLNGTVTSVDFLIQITAPHAYDYITTINTSVNFMEQQLLREIECERLFRLICKLNSVVERNDNKRTNESTPEWSETGDRYMLKLFRDFVFHQVDQCGAAHLDLAHILNTLNKVEAASTERLCLTSRDGQRMIISTFAEVRQWLDNSFAILVEEHRRSLFEQQMAQQQQQQQEQQENTTHDEACSKSAEMLGNVDRCDEEVLVYASTKRRDEPQPAQ